jgi:hypothetical protein
VVQWPAFQLEFCVDDYWEKARGRNCRIKRKQEKESRGK